MAVSLPTLRGTAQQALYPFKRTIKFSTLVSVNQDGSQQRSILDNPRVNFDLPFTRLNHTDKDAEKGLYATVSAQFATNLSLTMGNATYDWLSLDSDLYSGQVRAATMWDTSLKLSQTRAQNLRPTTTTTSSVTSGATSIPIANNQGFTGLITIGSETMFITFTPDPSHFTVLRGQLGTTAASHGSGATVSWGPAYSTGQAFPLLPNGTRTQIPWQQNQQYKTEVSQLEAGTKYTFAWYGAGLTNFPTEGLRQWVVGGDMLTDADLAVIEAHFLANWGRMFAFNFKDPETAVVYSNCYYTTDEMVIEYIAPNVNRVSLAIENYTGGGGLPPVPPTPPPHGAVVAAVLNAVTQYIPGSYDSFERSAIIDSSSGSNLQNFIFSNTGHSSATTTLNVLPGNLYQRLMDGTLSVSFFLEGTLWGTGSPSDEMLITDCWITITYADASTATLRPTVSSIIAGDPSLGSITFTLTAGVVSGDITQHDFNPFGNPGIGVLTSFA